MTLLITAVASTNTCAAAFFITDSLNFTSESRIFLCSDFAVALCAGSEYFSPFSKATWNNPV